MISASEKNYTTHIWREAKRLLERGFNGFIEAVAAKFMGFLKWAFIFFRLYRQIRRGLFVYVHIGLFLHSNL